MKFIHLFFSIVVNNLPTQEVHECDRSEVIGMVWVTGCQSFGDKANNTLLPDGRYCRTFPICVEQV